MRYIVLVVASLALGVVAGRQTVRVPEREGSVADAPKSAENQLSTPSGSPLPMAPPPHLKWSRDIGSGKMVPLSQVYAITDEDGGVKIVPSGDDDEFTALHTNVKRKLSSVGAQTAFLVRAATIFGAVRETSHALTTGDSLLELHRTGDVGIQPVWAFIFLGNHSIPTPWQVKSATLGPSELVFRYTSTTPTEPALGISDCHGYWIDLGQLPSGVFTIRIVDVSHNYETLSVSIRLVSE